MTFRDDLRTSPSDWVDAYLERVGELPVAARVEPGEIRAALPASPPEQGEPFAALLRDLDELILPGLTHWNHPALLRVVREHRLGAGHPRRAA